MTPHRYTTGSTTVAPPVQHPSQPAQQSTPQPPPQQSNTQPATQSPVSSQGNPFAGTEYYINPHYTIEVDSSIESNPSKSAMLSRVKQYASAFWIDRISVLDSIPFISSLPYPCKLVLPPLVTCSLSLPLISIMRYFDQYLYVTTILSQARMQGQNSEKQVMVTLVVYNLPSRDCAALASNGEIVCTNSECVEVFPILSQLIVVIIHTPRSKLSTF